MSLLFRGFDSRIEKNRVVQAAKADSGKCPDDSFTAGKADPEFLRSPFRSIPGYHIPATFEPEFPELLRNQESFPSCHTPFRRQGLVRHEPVDPIDQFPCLPGGDCHFDKTA